MINAKEARELANRVWEYKNLLDNHNRCVHIVIRSLASIGKTIGTYTIFELNGYMESLTHDLFNILECEGYSLKIITHKGHNVIEISW